MISILHYGTTEQYHNNVRGVRVVACFFFLCNTWFRLSSNGNPARKHSYGKTTQNYWSAFSKCSLRYTLFLRVTGFLKASPVFVRFFPSRFLEFLCSASASLVGFTTGTTMVKRQVPGRFGCASGLQASHGICYRVFMEHKTDKHICQTACASRLWFGKPARRWLW